MSTGGVTAGPTLDGVAGGVVDARGDLWAWHGDESLIEVAHDGTRRAMQPPGPHLANQLVSGVGEDVWLASTDQQAATGQIDHITPSGDTRATVPGDQDYRAATTAGDGTLWLVGASAGLPVLRYLAPNGSTGTLPISGVAHLSEGTTVAVAARDESLWAALTRADSSTRLLSARLVKATRQGITVSVEIPGRVTSISARRDGGAWILFEQASSNRCIGALVTPHGALRTFVVEEMADADGGCSYFTAAMAPDDTLWIGERSVFPGGKATLPCRTTGPCRLLHVGSDLRITGAPLPSGGSLRLYPGGASGRLWALEGESDKVVVAIDPSHGAVRELTLPFEYAYDWVSGSGPGLWMVTNGPPDQSYGSMARLDPT